MTMVEKSYSDPIFRTSDLYDHHADEVQVAEPLFRHYGGARRFCGPIATLKVYEDNLLVHEQLKEPGAGRVIVIDGGGSLRAALVGDTLAKRAREMGYAGFLIYGCIRDVAECAGIDIGLAALAACPARPKKKGFGERGLPLAFASVKFTPGEWLYADEDGVLTCARKLL
jgi:regulator of ribonuclease activity A